MHREPCYFWHLCGIPRYDARSYIVKGWKEGTTRIWNVQSAISAKRRYISDPAKRGYSPDGLPRMRQRERNQTALWCAKQRRELLGGQVIHAFL